VFNLVNLHVYHYAGNNPVKYTDPDGREDKPPLASRIVNLLKNDGSTRIQTIGATASGTVTMTSGAIGAGVYIDPKNDKLQTIATALTANPMTAPLGVGLMALNTEDIGVYAESSAGAGGGIAGSLSVSVSTYTSLDAARGPYLEGGGSGGPPGASIGADVIMDVKLGEVIGASASVGIGVGGGEGHARAGVSGFFSLKNLFNRGLDE
jgi:hypothetical protein